MTFKQAWEKAAEQHMLPAGVVESMVQQAYPAKKLVTQQLLAGGGANLNIKIAIEGEGQPQILRIYLRDPKAADREQQLGALLRGTVPVPVTQYIGEWEGYQFAITNYLAGTPLREVLLGNLADVGVLMAATGSVLAKIAAHTFERGGFFNHRLMVEAAAELGYLAYAETCLNHSNVVDQLNDVTRTAIQTGFQQQAAYFPELTACSLVHADFDPANVLVAKQHGTWQVTGVLDWEFAFSGSMLWDMANMLRYAHQMPPVFAEAFVQGIQEAGRVLPEYWQITVQLLNMLSLLDLLQRTDPLKRPKQAADLQALIAHLLGQWQLRQRIK